MRAIGKLKSFFIIVFTRWRTYSGDGKRELCSDNRLTIVFYIRIDK